MSATSSTARMPAQKPITAVQDRQGDLALAGEAPFAHNDPRAIYLRGVQQGAAKLAKGARFSSDNPGFGFLSLEQTGPRRWKVELHGTDGTVLRRCSITGRRTSCNPPVATQD